MSKFKLLAFIALVVGAVAVSQKQAQVKAATPIKYVVQPDGTLCPCTQGSTCWPQCNNTGNQ